MKHKNHSGKVIKVRRRCILLFSALLILAILSGCGRPAAQLDDID